MIAELRSLSVRDLNLLFISFLVATFLFWQPYLSYLLNFIVVGFIHELGHASVAILSGRVSIPIYFFVALTYNFSWLTVIFVWLMLGYLIFRAWRKSEYLYIIFFSALIISSLILIIIPNKYAELFITFHGIGGEITFAMLFIIIYFLNLPVRLNKARLFFSTLGFYIYFHNIYLWFAVLKDSSKLPIGSLMFGADHGDMNTLLAAGLSADNIAYIYLAWIILSIVLILFFLLLIFVYSPLKSRES